MTAPSDLIRAFVAVPVAGAAAHELEEFLASLRPLARLRWVTRAQLHITLRFLGEQTREAIERVKGALRPLALDFAPFDISLSRFGAFPSLERPRVLWLAGNQGAAKLTAWAGRVNDALLAVGIPKETRAFKPHLTLARAEGTDPFPQPLLRALEAMPPFGWRCEGFSLMRSRLTPKGAVYSEIRLS